VFNRSEVLFNIQFFQKLSYPLVSELRFVIGYYGLGNNEYGQDVLLEEFDDILRRYFGQRLHFDSFGEVIYDDNQKFHLTESLVKRS